MGATPKRDSIEQAPASSLTQTLSLDLAGVKDPGKPDPGVWRKQTAHEIFLVALTEHGSRQLEMVIK